MDARVGSGALGSVRIDRPFAFFHLCRYDEPAGADGIVGVAPTSATRCKGRYRKIHVLASG
jgi:hypothetical protein